MELTKLTSVPQGTVIPPEDAFGEARSVQSGTLRSCAGALRIESSGRFKRFGSGRELVIIERGSGHIKWKRGELPFSAGDVFEADEAQEYDFYGEGAFLVVKC